MIGMNRQDDKKSDFQNGNKYPRETVRPGRIELRIDELVLDGFTHKDRYLISRALESELTRYLAQPEGWSSLVQQEGNRDALSGGTIEIPKGASPSVVGAQIAKSVYGRMKS